MINIALIEKILKVSGENEENIVKLMDELGRTLNEKFAKSFIVFVEQNVKDESELEKLVGFVEKADQITPEKIQEYSEWTKKNSEVDFEEFWEGFEEETHKLEGKIIDNVKDKLTDAQKREVIDFIQGQTDELKKADEEYIKLLKEVGDAAKKQVQDEMSGSASSTPVEPPAVPATTVETSEVEIDGENDMDDDDDDDDEVDEDEQEENDDDKPVESQGDQPLFNEPAPNSNVNPDAVSDVLENDEIDDQSSVGAQGDQVPSEPAQMQPSQDQAPSEMPQQPQPMQTQQPSMAPQSQTPAPGGAFQGFQDITSSMKQYNDTSAGSATGDVSASTNSTDVANTDDDDVKVIF